MRSDNWKTFWPILIAIVASDVATKLLAVRSLIPERVPREVVGDWLRFTLVYNPGAAFGLQVGAQSRWVFMGLTVVALGILGRLYLNTRPGDLLRTASLGLVCGGALGNLIDRVRSDHGVVDFIDIGVGASRWPTFNVADVAVSVGAVVLAWTLWDSEQSESAVASTTLAAAESGELT